MMELQKWLEDGWKGLPAWRIDLGGEREQPLTIQWAGSSEDLAGYLVAKGWHLPPSFNLKNFMSMLSPDSPIGNLPLLPHLHDGRLEKVLLVREAADERWVFRLWRTDVQLKEMGEPLWIGTVEIQVEQKLADLIMVEKDKGDYMQPLDYLSQTLKGKFRLWEAYRGGEDIHGDSKHVDLGWNGRVLLAMEAIRQAPFAGKRNK